MSEFNAIRSSNLFSGCSESDCREVSRFSKQQHVAGGTLLFRAGEPCSAVYFVVAGLVKLFVTGPDPQHEKILEIIEPGQTFAEAAMFSGLGYPVNAVAIEDSTLVCVDAFSFMRYLRAHPDLTWRIMATMSRRLHQLVSQVRTMSLHSAEQRLANFLLEYFDPEEPARAVAHLPPRRSELASMIGITAETLCRVIVSFRKRGWIETRDADIFITEPEGLRSVLGFESERRDDA